MPKTYRGRLTFSSTDVNFIASQALARSQQRPDENADDDAAVESGERAAAMAELERQARAPRGFLPASSGTEGGSVPKVDKAHVTINPDAIELDITDGLS